MLLLEVADLMKEDLQYDVHTGDEASHAVDETHLKTPTLEEFLTRGVSLFGAEVDI